MPTRNVKGTMISYQERGSGVPLVLLHGFPLDARIFEPQLADLSDVCRVIVPDLCGFGQSRSDRPFTIESLGDDVHALLEEIAALPCVLGGLSMGGYVALGFCRKYPTDVDGLILIDTRATADTPEGRQGREAMIELVRREGSKAVAEQMMPKMLAPQTAEAKPELKRMLASMMEGCPPKTIENALAAMRDREDYSSELPSIADPTLILVGLHDPITPPEVAEAMRSQIPQAELHIIPEAGHMAPVEQPKAVNDAIRKFLKRIG